MASRSAVMISGERSANCASSFLRSAGASWAAAALRWMTRPARSSSTAGSGMPATTALTAAASTGLTRADVFARGAALCSRHGTSAAAAMQMKTATARSSERSPNATSTAKREAGGKQDDGRMPQPVRPRGKERGRTGIVYRHRAGFFLGSQAFSSLRSNTPRGCVVRRRCLHARAHRRPRVSARRRGRASTGAGASSRAPRITSRSVSKITDMTNGAI